jgi:hypothetical protein
MGHTRLTTQGNEHFNPNNHPFLGTTQSTSFALAHNGILRNDLKLRISEQLPSTKIKTDSYVAVQLIEKQNTLDFSSLRCMAEKVEGSFSFTVLDEDGNLYFVKGDSPMCIYKYASLGFYLYASTEDILKRSIHYIGLTKYKHEHVKISEGDILMLGVDGKERKERFDFDDIWYRWRYWSRMDVLRHSPNVCNFDDDYWNELKFVAKSYGYSSDDIERFRRLGYSPDAVEEIFYNDDKTMNNCDLYL